MVTNPPVGAALALVPGTQLGRYQLLRQLAIGGMAEVYLARSTGIEGFRKLVVIKRILPQYANDPKYVRMFLDEARLAAMLHHPNIVQVFDIGSQVGNYYIAMEYVRGEDVRSILGAAARRQAPIPLGVSLSIIQGLCRGLHHAHDQRDHDGKPLGIVHRDISPANVIVTYDGSAKLLDFGVAKAASHTRKTEAGSLKGKFGYMSPEQCLADPLDRRSDVFAIGILLYELTTGKRLYRSDSELKVLLKIAHEDAPAPSESLPNYPEALDRIVRRALCRRPDERYATAEDLERDLVAFVRDARLDDSRISVAEFLGSLFPDRAAENTAVPRPRGKARARVLDRSSEPSVLVTDNFGDEDSYDIPRGVHNPPAAGGLPGLMAEPSELSIVVIEDASSGDSNGVNAGALATQPVGDEPFASGTEPAYRVSLKRPVKLALSTVLAVAAVAMVIALPVFGGSEDTKPAAKANGPATERPAPAQPTANVATEPATVENSPTPPPTQEPTASAVADQPAPAHADAQETVEETDSLEASARSRKRRRRARRARRARAQASHSKSAPPSATRRSPSWNRDSALLPDL